MTENSFANYALTGAITCFAILGAVVAVNYGMGGDSNDGQTKKKDHKFPNLKKKKTTNSSSSSSTTIESSSEGDVVGSMKGYKKTLDGKTTSYFTREISEEDKAILAATNTGPVRLSGPGDSTQVCLCECVSSCNPLCITLFSI